MLQSKKFPASLQHRLLVLQPLSFSLSSESRSGNRYMSLSVDIGNWIPRCDCHLHPVTRIHAGANSHRRDYAGSRSPRARCVRDKRRLVIDYGLFYLMRDVHRPSWSEQQREPNRTGESTVCYAHSLIAGKRYHTWPRTDGTVFPHPW